MLLEIQAEMLKPCSVDPDVVKGSEAIYGGVYWLSVEISYVAQFQDHQRAADPSYFIGYTNSILQSMHFRNTGPRA